MRRGRLYKYQTGQLLPWAQAPYGYCSDPDKPRHPEGVQLEVAKAAIVEEIFNRYLAPDGTLSSVAKWLTKSGIPSPTGLAWWSPQTIRRILTNPVYTGKVFANRQRASPVQRRRSPLAPIGKGHSSRKAMPPQEWQFVAHVPAIVTQEQFDQVQAKFERNKQLAKRNNKAHHYLLRALVSCGVCRRTCRGQTSRKYAYYKCAGKDHFIRRSGSERCPSRLIPMKQLDAVVWDDLCRLITEPEIIVAALKRAQSGAWLPQELEARRQNLCRASNSLSNQVERLTQAYLAEVMGLEEYQRRRRDLERQIEAMQQQIHQLENQVNRQAKIAGWANSIEDFCQRVQTGLAAATFEQRRQLLELLIDRVVVTNEEVEIRYVIPLSPAAEQTRFYQLRQPYLCRVDVRLVQVWALDPSFEIVGHQHLGYAAQEGQRSHVRSNPVGQRLGRVRFGVRVITGP
jgi:site-specific DNA recombinase